MLLSFTSSDATVRWRNSTVVYLFTFLGGLAENILDPLPTDLISVGQASPGYDGNTVSSRGVGRSSGVVAAGPDVKISLRCNWDIRIALYCWRELGFDASHAFPITAVIQ